MSQPLFNGPINVIEVRIPVEVFTYTYNNGMTVSWNITRAQQLVKAEHYKPILVPRQHLEVIATEWDIDDSRLAKTDITQPGIATQIPVGDLDQPFDMDKIQLYTILIDGCHRAARAFKENKPFYAYLLTLKDNLACLMTQAEVKKLVPHPPLA